MRIVSVEIIRATNKHVGKKCPHPQCKKKEIKRGDDICESPTHPGFFYHYHCYRAIWESLNKPMIEITVPPPPAELN